MKIQTSFFKYCLLVILVFMTYKCSDDTLYSDLGHGSLDIDTLSISNIDILNYRPLLVQIQLLLIEEIQKR